MSGPRSAAQLPYELRRRKQLLDRSRRYCGAGHSEPPRYPQPIYPFPLTLPACMAVSAASSSFSATVSHVKYRAHAC
jgi:hypothetical protein